MKVKEEINKLLRVGLIRPVKQATWLSPIVAVPKKNGNIHICIDYQQVNDTAIKDKYLVPYIEH